MERGGGGGKAEKRKKVVDVGMDVDLNCRICLCSDLSLMDCSICVEIYCDMVDESRPIWSLVYIRLRCWIELRRWILPSTVYRLICQDTLLLSRYWHGLRHREWGFHLRAMSSSAV